MARSPSIRPLNRTTYRLFGLTVDASEPIPGLRPTSSHDATDIRIHLGFLPVRAVIDAGAQPWYVSPFRDAAERPVMTAWIAGEERFFHLVYPDGPEFLVDRTGTQVWADWPSLFTLTSVAPYLLGPVLAFALTRQRVVCLHASAVAIDGRAVLFLGPSRSGKSTIATWLASRGHRVLADDLVALDARDGHFTARPAFPWLRLQRSTVTALQGALQPPPALVSVWDEEYLDLELNQPGYQFQSRALPVGALYLIDREPAPSAGQERPLTAPDAVVELLASAWGSPVIDRERDLCAQEFAALADLVATVAIRRLPWSGRLGDLPAVADRVLGRRAGAVTMDSR